MAKVRCKGGSAATRRAPLALRRLRLGLAATAAFGAHATTTTAAADAHREVGRQGIVHVVLIAADAAGDAARHARAARAVCPPDGTCFVNFFVDPGRGVDVALPLPDAVAAQPTAVYRRSDKRGAEVWRWACRIQPGSEGCF